MEPIAYFDHEGIAWTLTQTATGWIGEPATNRTYRENNGQPITKLGPLPLAALQTLIEGVALAKEQIDLPEDAKEAIDEFDEAAAKNKKAAATWNLVPVVLLLAILLLDSKKKRKRRK